MNVHSAAKAICVSEDATRVASRIEYQYTDRLVTLFEQIEGIFLKESKASYAYLYMAQALSSGVPPFCFALIETDNFFTNKTTTMPTKRHTCG